MKFWKVIVAVLFSVSLMGCFNKYQQAVEITTPVANLTKSQVKSAILASGTTGQAAFGTWKMKELNSSTIQASLFNRGYSVVVNIPYSAKGYSIKYVSASNNLKDQNGNVHRNYNRWVNNLDVKIKKNVFMKQ